MGVLNLPVSPGFYFEEKAYWQKPEFYFSLILIVVLLTSIFLLVKKTKGKKLQKAGEK